MRILPMDRQPAISRVIQHLNQAGLQVMRSFDRQVARAEDHLHAIILMIEKDGPRDQVLHQLDAVQSALRMVGCALLQLQVERSIAAILQNPCDGERKTDLEKCLALFRLNALCLGSPPLRRSRRLVRLTRY